MKKVLVAEDDPVLLKILEKTFERYKDKFEFVLVPDGRKAMNVIMGGPIDLVVTDIQMPDMNGLILLAFIHTYHPALPCIVITSYATSRLKAKVPRGVLRFFHKPFKADDLAQAIVSALERHYPHRTKEGISVFGFLEMIEMEGIFCTLEVETSDNSKGVMYFQGGVLYNAECGSLEGEAAAMEIMRWEITKYAIKDLPETGVSRQIKSDIQDLIRNAVIDETEIEFPSI